MTETIELIISGRTFATCIAGSMVPTEENWPDPTIRRVGRNGSQHRYEVDRATRRLICSHIEMLLDCSSGWGSDDPDTARDRAAMKADLIRAGWLVKDGRWTYPGDQS